MHMIPRHIYGATVRLNPPANWDEETHGPCCRLYARVTDDGTYESAWEPTPDELAALNAGASVILAVKGGQPPVMLYVSPVAMDASK